MCRLDVRVNTIISIYYIQNVLLSKQIIRYSSKNQKLVVGVRTVIVIYYIQRDLLFKQTHTYLNIKQKVLLPNIKQEEINTLKVLFINITKQRNS